MIHCRSFSEETMRILWETMRINRVDPRYCTKAFVSSVSLNTVLFVNINYDAPCTCSSRYCSQHKCKYK